MKQQFEEYVRNTAADADNGKAHSYVLAIDHLNTWFAVNRPTWAPKDIWAMRDPAAVMDLYEHVLAEQERFRNGPNSVFEHVRGHRDSYIRKGWCAAALKAWAEFLAANGNGGGARVKVVPPSNTPARCAGKNKVKEAKNKALNCNDFGNLLSEFCKWGIEEGGLTSNTVSSYKTYINTLRAAVNKAFGDGWFEPLLTNPQKDLVGQKWHLCSEFIELQIANSVGKIKKDWRDCRSAFHKLEDFLADVTDFWTVGVEKLDNEKALTAKVKRTRKAIELPAEVQGTKKKTTRAASYTHSELFSNFKGRLKTQSRYYPCYDLLFPTRLLGRIFPGRGKNAWNEWLKNGIENTHILKSAEEKPVLFSKVRRIEIKANGEVVVTCAESSFVMMTRTAKGSIVTECAVCGMRDVSIDHIVPLESFLRKNKNKLLGLIALTKMFHTLEDKLGKKLNPRVERNWIDEFCAHYRDVLNSGEMRKLIESDLEVLKGLEYELMDRRENSKKGKGLK